MPARFGGCVPPFARGRMNASGLKGLVTHGGLAGVVRGRAGRGGGPGGAGEGVVALQVMRVGTAPCLSWTLMCAE
jgi:hypothetical protein